MKYLAGVWTPIFAFIERITHIRSATVASFGKKLVTWKSAAVFIFSAGPFDLPSFGSSESI